MRPLLAKATRKAFEREMKQRLPQFQQVKGSVVPPGDRLFVWEVGPNMFAYVLLGIFHLEDLIFLEIAWTPNKRWPGHTYSKGPFQPTAEGDIRFRLDELWKEKEPLELWRVGTKPKLDLLLREFTPLQDEQELLSEVDRVVMDSVDRLIKFGVPYFEKVAADHGYALSPNKFPKDR